MRGYANVAFVPQEVILFGGDLRSNIRYGRPDATRRKWWRPPSLLGVHQEFLTVLTPWWANEAFNFQGTAPTHRHRPGHLKDPDLLILDEATSALDSTSEREVQAALDALMQGRSSVVSPTASAR